MVQLANYSAANGPLTLLLQCNFQTRGAIGIYSWTPGSGNQWTLIHGDNQWASTSGPHVIPALPPGSKLHWIVGLITTAQPPAVVNGIVTLSQGGSPLDVVPVSGTATATQPVQAYKTYDL